MRFLVPLLLFVTTHAFGQNIKDSIDRLFKAKMEAAGIVGGAAAIVSDHKILWSDGYGYADSEKQIPYTVNTIMNIGSISKSITGICVMRAVQEKKLLLDADINTYLPFKVINPFFPKEKMTMRQLVIHTASIQDNDPAYGDSAYDYSGDPKIPLGDYLKAYLVPGGKYYADSNFVKAKPGTESYYSNVGAGLAGYIVECVTGMQLNAYSKKFMFTPLGLTRSGWKLRDIDTSQHSRLYNRQEDTLTRVPWYGLVTYPDGGVRTSVTDLSEMLLAMVNQGRRKGKQILAPAIARELWRPNFTKNDKPTNYDYDVVNYNEGVFWSMNDSTRKIGHVGRDPGVNTYMYYDRHLKRGIIIFYNTSIPYPVREQFEKLYDEFWRLSTLL